MEEFRDKESLKKYLLEECYDFCKNSVFEQMLDNVLNYAGNLSEIEQYNFLCEILPIVPERIIRQSYFSNEEIANER